MLKIIGLIKSVDQCSDIEEWRDIEGYEGLYQVSNMGRVKSLNRHMTGKEKVLKPQKHKWGYLHVLLSKNGKQRLMQVHRLVATAFIPNHDNLPQVNHKDEVKTNNCVDNLEWCDGKYNSNFGTRNERVAKALSKQVAQIDKSTGEVLKVFPSIMEVYRQLGYSHGCISACCRGLYKQMYGYKWRYV